MPGVSLVTKLTDNKKASGLVLSTQLLQSYSRGILEKIGMNVFSYYSLQESK